MKKALVLLALAMMAATPALAGPYYSIVNSRHDLSSLSTTDGAKGDFNEICVYCHTPHNARVESPTNNLPLWNRSAADVATLVAADLYNSLTLNQTYSGPTDVLASVNRSDVLLCLSCHDGTGLTDPVRNPPNSDANGLPNITNAFADNSSLDIWDTARLTNDHPIGMVYNSVQGIVAEELKVKPTNLNFYDGGKMWCSTCHDVHNPGFAISGSGAGYTQGTQFIATTMVGSYLCLQCHQK